MASQENPIDVADARVLPAARRRSDRGDQRRDRAAGRARRPNAYPDGCGDMHALPEPGAALALLGALPLLAWLGARRRRSSARR